MVCSVMIRPKMRRVPIACASTSGVVEGSNVNVVESLVQMIDHARHYMI